MKPYLFLLLLALHQPVQQPDHPITWLPRKQLECLVANVYHEARGEPILGQALVARTTLNRVGRWAPTVCGVVYQKHQFSWTRKPGPLDRHSREYYRAWQAAWLGVDSRATYHYYHAARARPGWARGLGPSNQIGNHKFYQ